MATKSAGAGNTGTLAPHLPAVLAAAMEAYIAFDTTGTVIAWNPAAEATFGYTLVPRRTADPSKNSSHHPPPAARAATNWRPWLRACPAAPGTGGCSGPPGTRTVTTSRSR